MSKRVVLQEDWVIVSLGFIIICVSIFAFVLPVPTFSWESSNDLFVKILSLKNLLKIGLLFVFSLGVFVVGALLSYKPLKNIFLAFPIVFVLTIIALIIAGNAQLKAINLEAVIFSLAIGLLIGNTIKLPYWFRSALSAEFFVKIGLVILGTTVIFSDIQKDGALGIVQAFIVVLSVWYFAFWLCKKLKIDDEMTMMIASAVSICGVSAAIATAGAIRGDAKKLSYVVSLVLITAIPMIILMPYIANYWGMSEKIAGAWLGGSIDTTGAVVASGALVGEEALKVSIIVKFSQNVLLGLAAFAISVYWTYTKKTDEKGQAIKPTLGVIWERFP
ncbi:MAG: YeiH family protein, partial [Thermoflexibacter sp.]|nr:YeiH family protein [Thermoflexibacter sp.]